MTLSNLQITPDPIHQIYDEKIRTNAPGLGHDVREFEFNMNDPEVQSRIRQDMQDGYQADVRGTPTIFVKWKQLRDRSRQGFQTAIDRELERLRKK